MKVWAAMASFAVMSVVGCGVGPTLSTSTGGNFGGTVFSGQQGVAGSHVAVFVAGVAGYGGTLTPVTTATTDSTGSFSISATYTCPSADSQLYVVATGGNPGLSGTVDNSGLFLVAALGACSAAPSASVTVDEVTTVAAAYALSGFLPSGGGGMVESAVTAGTAMPGVATSSTNVQGMKDAFANATNIVDNPTGTALVITATTAANGIVPQSEINTLANILQDCVNSAGPGSTPCTSLFAAATPPAASGVSAPVNVFQAMLNVARYPGNNVSTLLALQSANAGFLPDLPEGTALNDWTLGITYSSSLLASGTGMNVDASDNVYVAGAGYLLEFNAQGEPLSSGANLFASDASINTNDTLREIQFDKSGNLFVTDGNLTGVYEYAPGSGTITFRNFDAAPASVVNANTYGVAVDALGDVWTASYSKSGCATASTSCQMVEFVAGTNYTPYTTFPSGNYVANQPSGALGGARGIAFDVNTGNVWYTAIDDNLGGLFKVTPSATGQATATGNARTLTGFGTEAGAPSSNTAYGTIAVAVDAASNAWFVVAGGPVETGKNATAAIPAALYPVSSAGVVGTAVTGGGLNAPDVVVVDGGGNLFVANSGTGAPTSSVIEYSPSASTFLSPNIGFDPGATYAAGALTSGALYEPSYIAVDKSGALWVLNSGSGSKGPGTLVQMLGVAAPTDPVLADGKYGAKP